MVVWSPHISTRHKHQSRTRLWRDVILIVNVKWSMSFGMHKARFGWRTPWPLQNGGFRFPARFGSCCLNGLHGHFTARATEPASLGASTACHEAGLAIRKGELRVPLKSKWACEATFPFCLRCWGSAPRLKRPKASASTAARAWPLSSRRPRDVKNRGTGGLLRFALRPGFFKDEF